MLLGLLGLLLSSLLGTVVQTAVELVVAAAAAVVQHAVGVHDGGAHEHNRLNGSRLKSVKIVDRFRLFCLSWKLDLKGGK